MQYRDVNEDGLALIYIDRYVGHFPVWWRPSLCSHHRHLVHEVTSPQAFEGLYVSCGEIIFRVCVDELIICRRNAGRGVRRPDCTLATVDHNIPYDLSWSTDIRPHWFFFRTASRQNFQSVESFIIEPDSRAQCAALEDNVKEFGLTYFGMRDRRQGNWPRPMAKQVNATANLVSFRHCTRNWSWARIHSKLLI